MKKIELLAPAQNLSCARAAITFGADAVYIGANSFGARKNAANSLEDIEKLVNFAHKFDVKIYVTINTILTDDELKRARELIFRLYEIGADAIIFQDTGLLELDLPPIELHASTQCDIRTVEKVKFLEEIGVKRAILARELSVSKIKEISRNTNIELECFIHGALCVSYSGQCYLSASIGGRSANRGECAQACRKKYSLQDTYGNPLTDEKYLLSLKDFCAEKYLDELVLSGVTSFKIEGRLKDETYVKNVVLYYRRLLDKYEKTSSGEVFADFEPDINKSFNRGFTTYFLDKPDEIFNFDTPKSTGEYLGRVSKVFKGGFEIETEAEISAQDGLCFLGEKSLEGFLVNKTENKKVYPNKPVHLKSGDKIYRNQNPKFEAIVKNSKTKRLMGAKVSLFEDKIAAAFNGFKVEIKLENPAFAVNPEKMKENFIKSFKKSGEGIFYAKDILFECKKVPFLPFSALNSLRREIFSKLEKAKIYQKQICKRTAKYPAYPASPRDYRLNIHNSKAAEFYAKCKVAPLIFSLESSGLYRGAELMRTKHCIRRALNLCLKNGGNPKPLVLVDKTGAKYPLEFDCKKCEMALKKS